MENPNTIEQKVRTVLEQDADTRNDDRTLYVRLCDTYIRGISQQRLDIVLLPYKLSGLPGYESVSRIRRKVQAEQPELLGSTRTQQARQEQEQVYKKF